MRLRPIFLLLLLLYSVVTWGQALSFRHITTAEGLLSDMNLRMAEDRIGRLWIGSNEGVNVFDGYEITSYSVPDNSGLASNDVLEIYCDKHGTIWMATAKGIQYRTEDGQRFISAPSQTGLPITNGAIFFETDNDFFLLGSDSGYVLTKSLQWKTVPALCQLLKTHKLPRAICRINESLWLWGCTTTAMLVNTTNMQLRQEYPIKSTWTICKAGDSSVVIGSYTRDSVILLNIYSGLQQNIGAWKNAKGNLMGGYIGGVAAIDNNKIALAGRYSGLNIVDLQQRSFTRYLHDPGDIHSIKSSFIRRLFITKNGTIFLSGIGLSYSSLQPRQIQSVKSFQDFAGKRTDGVVNCFAKDANGNMWIGNNSHLIQWDRQQNNSKFYSFYDERDSSRSVRAIRAIATDSLKRIWVGTFVGGLGYLQNGEIVQMAVNKSREPNALPSNNISALKPDGKGNIFICTLGGFCLFNPIKKTFTTYYDHPALKTVAGKEMYDWMTDKNGKWWLVEITGVWCYNHLKDTLIKIDTKIAGHPINNFNIAEDKGGNKYISTSAGVIIVPNGTYTANRVINKSEGLATDIVYAVMADQEGDIWISGNRGIARYNPVNNSIKTFDAYDGALQSNHKINSYFLAPDGEVFFGGEDGFNYFYPLALNDKQQKLNILIKNIALPDSLINTISANDITLPHYYNSLLFNYAVTDFLLAPYIRYRYRLQGLDTVYVYAGRQRSARYTNLSAGEYTFIAEASINGKQWFGTNKPLVIHIKKAYWQTVWFKLLMGLLAASLLYSMYYLRMQQVRQEEILKRDFEKKMNQVQMNLLRAQMNPHFIYNSLNSINSFILKSDRQNASGYLTKFSRLMRLILDNSRNEWVTLDNEIKALELYLQLEALRFNHVFDYSFVVGSYIDTANTLVPPMLIQPYIENAVWHGLLHRKQGGGLLQINISENENKLVIVIEDNGIGRAAASTLQSKQALQQKSYGMKITAERINIVNEVYNINATAEVKDLIDEEEKAVGTRVILSVDKIVAKT